MKGICFKEPMFHAVVGKIKTTTCRTGTLRYLEGETLYLKEPYAGEQAHIFYKFDSKDAEYVDTERLIWKNKLFMPANAARFYIIVTSTMCLHLKLLSGDDFIDEGIQQDAAGFHYGTSKRFQTDNEAFIDLWDSINGRGAYDLNPLVWLYRFKLIEP